MNNEAKPLSESELAKQRVVAVHPEANVGGHGYEVWIRAVRLGPAISDIFCGGRNLSPEEWEAIDARAWINAASKLPQPLSEDRPHNQPIPCPTCTGPIFVREDSSIVAHYNGDGDRCAANETKMPCDCWKHERQVCDICQKFDPHAKDEDREDNFTRAARFAGISFSQGIQFHLFMLHLLGKGPEPGFLLDSQKPVLKDGPSEGIADADNFYAELKAELISRGSKFFSPKAAEPASPVVGNGLCSIGECENPVAVGDKLICRCVQLVHPTLVVVPEERNFTELIADLTSYAYDDGRMHFSITRGEALRIARACAELSPLVVSVEERLPKEELDALWSAAEMKSGSPWAECFIRPELLLKLIAMARLSAHSSPLPVGHWAIMSKDAGQIGCIGAPATVVPMSSADCKMCAKEPTQ